MTFVETSSLTLDIRGCNRDSVSLFIFHRKEKEKVAGDRFPSKASLFSGDGSRRTVPVPAVTLRDRSHFFRIHPQAPVGKRRPLRQLEARGGDEQRRRVVSRAGELRAVRG